MCLQQATVLSLKLLQGDDNQGWHRGLRLREVKGEDTRTCTDANSGTHKYLAPDAPVVEAQIARMHVVWQPLGGPRRSETAALKCFRVTGWQSEESRRRINESHWRSVRQWEERSTWLLLDVYLNDLGLSDTQFPESQTRTSSRYPLKHCQTLFVNKCNENSTIQSYLPLLCHR